MGNICDICKDGDGESQDSNGNLGNGIGALDDNNTIGTKTETIPDSEYYKNLVADAQRKFLSASTRPITVQIPQEEILALKSNLLNKTVDESIVNLRKGKNNKNYSNLHGHALDRVVDVLGEPISTDDYDIVADELAEIVNKHTLTLDHENDATNYVAPIKRSK